MLPGHTRRPRHTVQEARHKGWQGSLTLVPGVRSWQPVLPALGPMLHGWQVVSQPGRALLGSGLACSHCCRLKPGYCGREASFCRGSPSTASSSSALASLHMHRSFGLHGVPTAPRSPPWMQALGQSLGLLCMLRSKQLLSQPASLLMVHSIQLQVRGMQSV